MGNLDVVVPGQFTDLQKKEQLWALGEVLRETTENLESASTTIITTNTMITAFSTITNTAYPFL